MHSYYGLTETEYELMTLFWKKQKPLTLAEIVHYCNEEFHHDWATTTVCTYLSHLVMKGFLTTNQKRYRKSYTALVSQKDLSQSYAHQLLQDSFDGSLKNFLVSFTDGVSLSSEEVNELIDILHSSISDNES
ncbi:BlaI/MecI/CopY family transcriptional regulator [Jingyaoa shaoxingensis]|uniref:BlaI/MecI/CopY family transcriptional regulator n=1 Tax=Jingyaoa shaoxingensis TaxID=2763671 RepID=A0ABR7N8B9_9FIRM|nr:BlaI/MecI/CopY family transcriptional regulator [Jingyaoa shaoxingensis]MBC8572616.1 BlaI/MecI/CopY family transcriptional regulator [Jingyaoa shaoxingensis]